jgi:hypothetical protein
MVPMDEKTEELRDIFVEVTDEETVTEQQAEGRGSLTDADEAEIESRIEAVIERMRERYDFGTDLDDDQLCQVVRGFFDGDDDGDIAADLGIDADTVFRARMDLHLLAEDDTEFPFDLAALRRERADEDAGGDTARDAEALAADLDAAPETVERGLLVADTQDAVRRVSQRFQSEFEDAIPDAALAVQLTESVTDDGLEEAAEDIETDTKF